MTEPLNNTAKKNKKNCFYFKEKVFLFLNEKELKDLQKFGKQIEIQPPVQKKVEPSCNTNNSSFVYYKRTEHVIIRFSRFVLKKVIKFSKIFAKWTFAKLKILKFKLNKIILNIRKPSVFNVFKKPMCYKIVETCKHSRNKTVIVRKRVPISYKELVFSGRRCETGSVYYLTLKNNGENGCTSKVEAYGRLKKSSWDFPLDR